jgi:oxaloacetate decarboxylase alpha subunit
MTTDPRVIESQIPGGMISNLLSQLKEQKSLHRFDDVIKEIPLIQKELGYPPLVTPISQMVVVQAISNIISGERYKNVISEIVVYLKGEYGTPPGEVDIKLYKSIFGQEKMDINRPITLLEPLFKKVKDKHGDYSENDILTMILFPNVATEFFKKRKDHYHYKVSELSTKIHRHKNKVENDDVKAIISAIFAHQFRINVNDVAIDNIYEV